MFEKENYEEYIEKKEFHGSYQQNFDSDEIFQMNYKKRCRKRNIGRKLLCRQVQV